MTTPAPALPSDQNHTQQQQQHHQHHTQQSATSQNTMIGAEQLSASPMAAAPFAPVNGHKRATRSPEPRPAAKEQDVAPVEPAAKKIRTGEDAMEEQIQEAVQSEGDVSTAQTPAVSAPMAASSLEQMAPRASSPARAPSIPPPSPKKAPIAPTEVPPASTPVPAPAKADEEMKEESHAMQVDAAVPPTIPTAMPAAPTPAPAAPTPAPVLATPAPAPVVEAPKQEAAPFASPSVAPTSTSVPEGKVPALGTYPDCMIFTPPRFGVQDPEENEALNKEQLKFCGAALRQMKKHKPTIDVFMAPVDPVAMGIPQYPQFVQEPMDVSTIERKMQRNQYANAQAFVHDVYLMVNNAIIFNRPDHFVHANAHKLKSWFDGYMSRLPTTVPVRSFGTPKTKLADIDTRPKRDVNPPKDLLTASPLAQTPNPIRKTDPSRHKDDLKIASLVLKEVMKPKHINVNVIFLEPVDPIALNVPTYFDVIKQPMDLSTIKRKLEHNQYPTLEAFESDMRIMINNCLTFNHPSDPVYAMGLEFQRLFNREMAAKTEAFIAEPTLSAADQEEESRISIEVDLIEKNIAELQSRLAPLKDRLAAFQQKRRSSSSTAPSTMKKQRQNAMHRTPKHAHHTPAHAKTTSKKASRAPHYAGARAAPATGAHHGSSSAGDAGRKLLTGNKPLTLEQKQLLSQAVSRMDDDNLALVVDMIKKSMPSLFGSSDEIELDIESIDDRTQRDLYNFAVGNAAPATEKKNPAAGRLEQLSGALQQERKQERSHYSSGSEDEGDDSE